jgi:hypothetical protein
MPELKGVIHPTLDDGRVNVARPLQHHEESGQLIMIADECLSPQDCDLIMMEYQKVSQSKVNIDEKNSVMPENEKLLEGNIPWKYATEDNRKICVIPQTSSAFNIITEIVDNFMPKNDDYEGINYMTIQEYPTGTFFPTHKDDADGRDTGTIIFTLNDEFQGGELMVNGHMLKCKRGTMIAFNNNTRTFHSVEPISKGVRFTLCIWFGKFETDTIEK